MRLPPFLRRKPVIRCCLRDCNSRAKYSAGVKHMTMEGLGSSTLGTIRPICDSEKCLTTMKRVQQTDQITLTPIGSSIYSVAA